jgi:hypothetical protein
MLATLSKIVTLIWRFGHLLMWRTNRLVRKPAAASATALKPAFVRARTLQKLTGTDVDISSELLRGRSRWRPRYGNRLRHLDAKNR